MSAKCQKQTSRWLHPVLNIATRARAQNPGKRLSTLLIALHVPCRLASRINGQGKEKTSHRADVVIRWFIAPKANSKKRGVDEKDTFYPKMAAPAYTDWKKVMTYRLPNKQVRWTIFLGFLALVYVDTFSVQVPAITKDDRRVASGTGTDRKLTRLPTGFEQDIANYCKGDAACINNAYAQIERDKGRCATDTDLQNFSRSYCESFAIAAVMTNLKWGPGSDTIGLNNLVHLQRRMNALHREFN